MKKLLVICMLFSLAAQTSLGQSLEDAKKAIAQEDYNKAKSVLQSLMNAGKKPEYHYYLGIAFLEEAIENEDDKSQRDAGLEQAKKQFDAGIALKNKYPYNFLGLGRYFVEKKNLSEAQKNFVKAYDLSGGSDLELIIELAEGYVSAGDKSFLDEATKLLTKAQSMDSKNANIYIALGDVWEKQNIAELAFTNYKKATELNPNLVRAHFKVGKFLLKDKEYNEGAEAFKKAIQIDPNFAPAYREMGELYFRAGRYKEAKDNYKAYVEKTANDLQAEVRYCQFLYLSKEYNEAITNINKVLKDTTTNVLLRLLGYSYVATEKFNEGKQTLDKYFARMKPENLIALDFEYYAKALDKMGQDSLAVTYYEKTMEMDKTKNLYSTIAECWMNVKSYQKAADAYEKSIASKPNIKDFFYLGKTYQKLNNLDKAEEAFKKVVEQKTDFLPAYQELARIAAKKDPDTKLYLAKPYYEKILELTEKEQDKYKNDRANAYKYLAFHYYDTKDNPKAYKYAEKALQLDPNDKNSQQILDYLKKINVKPAE